MQKPSSRQLFLARPRTRTILLFTLAAVTTYFLLFSGPSPQFQVVPYLRPSKPATPEEHTPIQKPLTSGAGGGKLSAEGDTELYARNVWDVDIRDLRQWDDEDDPEDFDHVEPGEERDGLDRDIFVIGNLQHEKDLRKMWRYIYKKTAKLATSNTIYGNTLATLDYKDARTPELEAKLTTDTSAKYDFIDDSPARYNPYPDYNSDSWSRAGHAPYFPCQGPDGNYIEDLLVFRGRPHAWPKAQMGSYEALGMDPNLCWERDTRLGPYGYKESQYANGEPEDDGEWDNVNWGDLQRRCVHKNSKRFDLSRTRENPYLDAYEETAGYTKRSPEATDEDSHFIVSKGPDSSTSNETTYEGEIFNPKTGYVAERRTAVLLRAYTGMTYSENDKQVIRAMVSELSLKSGGQYEIFLLLHVKDEDLDIFNDPEVYQEVLQEHVPQEFHGMTVLWNDEVIGDIYTEFEDDNARSVHMAQWMAVQKFSHDHPQFDFIWQWEMDFRYTGQHYDLLDHLAKFARKQPRKGQWERNARWYIPDYHGDYDTSFRASVEKEHGNNTIWGPVELPFVNPVGPVPPVKSPGEDNYEWGVGEEADVITVGPMFDPINSNWIIGHDIWGYSDEDHRKEDLPRRATIVTQSRISKRLLDVMHVENMRANHIASEMTPQTVALLHGLKAVFAPHPVFTDRGWDGDFMNSWFNPSDHGDTGGYGCPMGWGRERRYQGNTWYYRAYPPNRLYNNWMGWTDTNVGGKRWEAKRGRPCLPSIMLHPIKNSEPTESDHESGFSLAFG